MTDDTVTVALARLDRAIARLEGSVAARASGRVGMAEAYAQLDERHVLLRARIQETIARLDAMIGAAD